MEQAQSPQVAAPQRSTTETQAPETTPAAGGTALQPYGNAASQAALPPGGGGGGDAGLANYQATLGEFLGGQLHKAVSGALAFDKMQGYGKSAVDGAISAAVSQLGGWDKIKADPAALDALVTMLQQNLEPLVEKWLASEDGRALVAKLQNWAGANPKTVVAVALLAAAGAVLANVDIPALKSSFKIGDKVTAELEAELGKVREIALQKVRGKLSYQSGSLLAAVEITHQNGETTALAEVKGTNTTVSLGGTFDGDGLKVAGLNSVLGLGGGDQLSAGVSSERGRSGVLSTISLVDKDGKLTRTNDFTFDSGSGVLTLGQSVLADLGGGFSFSQSAKSGSDGTASQSLGLKLSRDDLKAELDAAFSLAGGVTTTTVGAKAERNWASGYRAGGELKLQNSDLMQVGAHFGFKDPKEFNSWLVSYRRDAQVDEQQFALTVERKLGEYYTRFSGSYTEGITGGRVDAAGHAGRFINKDTALVGGLNLQHNLGGGGTSVKPEVGVQYKGVQVLFGYDAKEKAGTIRLGIPF